MGRSLAAVVWLVLSQTRPLGDDTWRLIFLVGALPAFCVFYLMRALEESERWLSAVRERRWEALSLPRLNLKAPWHGYPLSEWTNENIEEAELAVTGRYFETGAKLAKRRGPSDTSS